MKEIKSVGIIGMGALGVLYGTQLQKQLDKNHLAFIVNQERKNRYESTEMTFNGEVLDFTFSLPNERTFDLILFAVKGTNLHESLELAKEASHKYTVYLSVLNGISSEEEIGEVFGMDHLVYAIAQGMDTLKLGKDITTTNYGTLFIGTNPEYPLQQQTLTLIQSLLDRTGISYITEEEMMYRYWSKWMLNCGVNQVVMLFDGTYKTIQQPGQARDLMIEAMKEVILLSKYEGINLTDEELQNYLDIVDGLDPESMPSMRQDGYLKKPSEVHMFSGTVMRLAAKHNVACPVNRMLFQKIVIKESEY